ncbi:MAG: hypothetical protein EOO91_00450 [Pedobacter sp.]|nr:MAG: hypothetical protein EOO91_00450 [Pedobacter sp.]
MRYNFSIEDLIPLLATGGLLTASMYHSILFYHNRIKLLGYYSLYLWSSLIFIILTNFSKDLVQHQSIYSFTMSAIVLWVSYSLYIRFILITTNPINKEHARYIRYTKRIWLIIPVGSLVNVTAYVAQNDLKLLFSILALLFNSGVLLYVIIILCILFKDKRHLVNQNILGGGICMVFFNIFNGIAMYNNGILFGITSLSYICFGYFTEIIFFSIAISYKMRFDLDEKYKALVKIKTQEIELEAEKKKLTDTILANHAAVQKERTKAIIEQRTLIGRKLHDELSGNLVAIKYLITDFKGKASSKAERERLENIEGEINFIYKETRNYSHELSLNIEVTKNKLAYDIDACLKKLENQFSNIGLINIHSSYHVADLTRLTIEQNNHLYFFIKEGIVNTIKHAKAQNIWVVIKITEDKCNFSFTDDGKGFIESSNNGIGISNLKQRARDLNTELEIKTDEKGTAITLSLALR